MPSRRAPVSVGRKVPWAIVVIVVAAVSLKPNEKPQRRHSPGVGHEREIVLPSGATSSISMSLGKLWVKSTISTLVPFTGPASP